MRPFVAPLCARCPGHRGVTVAVPAGRTVAAAFPGSVHFAGEVAGRPYVVLDLGSAVLLTYGGLAEPAVARGARVAAGQVLGYSQGEVYVGVRRHGVPVEPTVLFGGTRVRLVPPPSFTCPVGPATPPR
ncbi:MAG: hypothetical protein RLZZ305_1629 [Actinomycetota bacterium]